MDDNDYPPESSSGRVRRKGDAKVAIPRIRGHDYRLPLPTRTPRVRGEVVSKACTQCRKRKIKCSGDRRRCTNCEKQGHDCHYDQERRDRLRAATRKSQALTALLIEVSSQLDAAGRKKIEDLLASFDDDTPPPPTPPPATVSQGKRMRGASASHAPADDDDQSVTSADGGEAHVAASVGSTEDVDFIEEDLLQDNEASTADYMGRNSHVQWLRALEVKIEQPQGEPSDMEYGPPGASTDAFNKRADALHDRQQSTQQRTREKGYFKDYYFYLDKTDIHMNIGDPHIVPTAATAGRLFKYYKETVHSPFHLLDDMFEAQLTLYYSRIDDGVKLNVCCKWKAVMNLVFAIGARYSHLIGADGPPDDRRHLVYMWRAVHLLDMGSINLNTLVGHPDQSVIQAAGLLSFYYLTIGHVNRAWYMIGIALRHAQAVGLHLRHEGLSVSGNRRETLARIWWALYSIESAITAITGRPRVVATKDCTVPPPGAKGTEMQAIPHQTTTAAYQLSTSSSAASGAPTSSTPQLGDEGVIAPFEVAYVKLDILMDKILSGLYSARNSTHSWKQAQSEISLLTKALDTWAARSLTPGPLRATIATERREQVLLYLYYYNAKICITRPCLCRLDRRIKGQSEESARFNQKTAEACINAALDITSLLPDAANSTWLYENGPWWCAVHIIMQGLTVLLLELSLDGIHLSVEQTYVRSCADKLISWLESMKTVDGVSGNASKIVSAVLNKQKQQHPDVMTEKQMPQPAMEEVEEPYQQHQPQQQQYNPQAPAFNPQQQSETYTQDPTSQQPDITWPSDNAFNDQNFYLPPNTGSFYPDDVFGSEYLNDPNAGLFEFGQPQMRLFYGNPYSSSFDQWEWDQPGFGGDLWSSQSQSQSQGGGDQGGKE
ncbi:hypothetical protein BDW02DRAFT_634918 [Decorospora gaudefroyi]|uniref:Zn(2)-C6 fungal-type domain-containing protein n=1 Tax=Decorospora gaudefroyi TaxID=184978 RepID=A0A6A5JYM4_9PLEO|nr:hypothetical protein BDW02DRAFT_634918 [Decorospora gaudefroyi]